jgi:hypothetical protein
MIPNPGDDPMKTPTLSLLTLLCLTPLLTGCGGSPSVEEVRWELQHRFPEARFEPDEHVRLGPISMGLLHGLVRMAADDEQAKTMVSGIHGIDFASYKVHGLPDLDRAAADPRFERQLQGAGWSLMVRTREEKERTWVYVRSDEQGALRNLFVVSLEAEELTLVRVDGRIDQAFIAAMAEHPKKVLGGHHDKEKEKEKTAALATPAGAP